MTKEIIFSSVISDLIEQPTPSLLKIPKTYKNMSTSYGSSKYFNMTVKKCIPFLDALTIGYIITTPVDYIVKILQQTKNGEPHTFFDLYFNNNIPKEYQDYIGIADHPIKQVDKNLRSDYRTVDAILKFKNPWTIKTPPGYSCIFTQPFNRNLPYKIIDGVVDTDQYNLPVHFPFYWTQKICEETFIPKGTPMALVIPFKRDNWKMKITKQSSDDLKKNGFKLHSYLRDMYKRYFWRKKSFK
jgi:hypothetical protein